MTYQTQEIDTFIIHILSYLDITKSNLTWSQVFWYLKKSILPKKDKNIKDMNYAGNNIKLT